jgi:hypothetical protein
MQVTLLTLLFFSHAALLCRQRGYLGSLPARDVLRVQWGVFVPNVNIVADAARGGVRTRGKAPKESMLYQEAYGSLGSKRRRNVTCRGPMQVTLLRIE